MATNIAIKEALIAVYIIRVKTFQPRPVQPQSFFLLMNFSTLEGSRIEEFMVEKSGVEKYRVEMFTSVKDALSNGAQL